MLFRGVRRCFRLEQAQRSADWLACCRVATSCASARDKEKVQLYYLGFTGYSAVLWRGQFRIVGWALLPVLSNRVRKQSSGKSAQATFFKSCTFSKPDGNPHGHRRYSRSE